MLEEKRTVVFDDVTLVEPEEQPEEDVAVKHERFAQLIALRRARRQEVFEHQRLDAVPDPCLHSSAAFLIGLDPGLLPQSSSVSSPGKETKEALRRRGTNFALLPPSLRALRRLNISIEKALVEETEEKIRKEVEEQLMKLNEARQPSEAEEISQEFPDLKEEESSASLAETTSGLDTDEGRRKKKFTYRVMTQVDLAVRHKIEIDKDDNSGVQDWVDQLTKGDVIPMNSLKVPDIELQFEVQKKRTNSRTKAHGTRRRSPSTFQSSSTDALAQTIPELSSVSPMSQTTKKNRRGLNDIFQSYNDHLYVTNEALRVLHAAKDQQEAEQRQLEEMQRRGKKTVVCPLKDVTTVLYFPSPADHEPYCPHEKRFGSLQTVVRQLYSGFRLSEPVVRLILSRSSRGLFAFSTRDFPTPFEYRVVITPRQFFFNLLRFAKDLLSPLQLRKIVYFCCGRRVSELHVWDSVNKKVMQQRQSRESAGLPKTAEDEDDDDIIFGDTVLRANPSCRLPNSAIDVQMELIVSRKVKDKRRGNENALPDYVPFSLWLDSLVSVQDVSARFVELVTRNGGEQQLLDAYYLMLTPDHMNLRRVHEGSKMKGLLPPSEIFVPPNVTRVTLGKAELTFGSKARDRQAVASLNFVVRYRDNIHDHLHRLIGDLGDDEEDDPTNMQSSFFFPAQLTKGGVKSVPIPKELMEFPEDEVDPRWALVEGWPYPTRGGYSPASAGPTEKTGKKKKKKSDEFGSYAPKEMVVADPVELSSIGAPLLITSPDEDTNDVENANDALDSPQHNQPKRSGESLGPTVMMCGQGLYFEAFVKSMQQSPAVALECLPLLLRYALDFSN